MKSKMLQIERKKFASNVPRICAVAAIYRFVVKIYKFPAEYFLAKENKPAIA
jgi:hypothetical protein